MFELVKKQIRPSKDIQFFSSADSPDITNETRNYLVQNFRNTGKIISSETSWSEDELTMTTRSFWKDRESLLEYLCDPIIADGITIHNTAYNKKHNITSTVSVPKEK
jgi:hypothetical protein